MQPEDVDLETALKLLALPRELGQDPRSDTAVVVYNGRFGPYIKCGDETRSLPADLSPLEITLGRALELLAEPKKSRRGFGAKKEPLKVFDASPVTQQQVQLLDGRYGPYVTDGVTNASLPKEAKVEEVTFPQALELLAARAAKGPAKKKRSARKKAAGKKTGGGKKGTAPKRGTAQKSSGAKKSASRRKS